MTAHVDWRLHGVGVDLCNCAYGCPCQFNAPPTNGNCEAAVGFRIEQGHFADVSLNDCMWPALFPGRELFMRGAVSARPLSMSVQTTRSATRY
nr:DUF1326 domain-containing protein [Pseudomonas anguilliseptica]